MARINREGVDRFFDYDFHMETRTIYIGDADEDGVNPQMAERAIKALHMLLAADKEKEIKIILNSMGGDFYHGMAIYDAIQASTAHITIEVFGSCMSMASIILQAGDERVLHPNSVFMIHDGFEGLFGTPKTVEAWADQSKISRKKMYDIYAVKSGKPASFWEKKCASDYILSAQEAVELGLADRIAGEEEAK